ncbi:CAP domain-containing protein [Roseovarius aestuariivivens]|uniref:CAP domain-containing protein n=1 Tax=Roseovarius aestuariivivens TaxID=1888910 RepID=UPI0010809D99|nr:CAP domain-containing protein [Roseovarius aestuariivivens]
MPQTASASITHFPTVDEQVMLELINRIRLEPEREFDRLITDAETKTAVTPEISAALRFFNVDMALLKSQFDALTPAAPVAWNDSLAQSSDTHSQLMIFHDMQSHNLPNEADLLQRFIDAGYERIQRVAENIFAFTEDPLHGHAGFVIDWGFSSTGIQTPPGHRNTIMNSIYQEVGISMLEETDPLTDVGPLVVTQHLGARYGYAPQVLGVVYDDRDGDNAYDGGEGLGNVSVTLTGDAGQFQTTSWSTGGYQIEVPSGAYTVTFSGDGLTGEITFETVLGDQNVKLDALADWAIEVAASPTLGPDFLRGTAGNDTLAGLGGDDTIDGGIGADTMNGGPGSDLFFVDDAGDRVAESNRWAGHDTVISSVDFRMGRSHIEDLELTGTARVGAGNGLTNRITGNDGDNILDGGKNNDTLVGGLGDDRYLVRAPGDTVVEQAGEGVDVVLAYRSYALEANVENLFIQTVYTKGGDPAIFNGIGNALDNTIVGTPFANTIVGREGKDTLKGQAGADTFVFDRAIGPDNVDRIIDFNTNEANEGDKLLMKGSEFGNMAAGVLAAGQFAQGTAAADANDRFIFDQASGQLWFDADGSGAGAQELIATFELNANVTAADIEIF